MNKLTTLIIVVISFGLISTQAIAADRLSASDFFYGESIINTVEVVKADNRQERTDIATQPINLSASEFFYGYTIATQIWPVKADDRQERTDVAKQPKNQLTPEVFYGYSDVNSSSDKCADC